MLYLVTHLDTDVSVAASNLFCQQFIRAVKKVFTFSAVCTTRYVWIFQHWCIRAAERIFFVLLLLLFRSQIPAFLFCFLLVVGLSHCTVKFVRFACFDVVFPACSLFSFVFYYVNYFCTPTRFCRIMSYLYQIWGRCCSRDYISNFNPMFGARIKCPRKNNTAKNSNIELIILNFIFRQSNLIRNMCG